MKTKHTYLKKSHVYWTAKKLNKHSQKIWITIVALMALVTVWAVINREVNKNPLISPLVSPLVTLPHVSQVQASELRKEDTKAWKMYQRIRWVESNNGTKGLAVTCKNKGMFNETGYRALQGFCFKSEWDQELTIMNYIENRLNHGWTENEVYCYFNSGKKTNTCPYAVGDLKNAN